MIPMYQIITAVVTGGFMLAAFLLQHVFLSRKRKIEDVTGSLIPRRAELYREFLQKICGTGIQYDYDAGDSKKQTIAFLHETCNRALYELAPFASEPFFECVMKLSVVCGKNRPGIEAEDTPELWKKFKYEFQFWFMEILSLVREDCMGAAIDRFTKVTFKPLKPF